jgi:hypothetical protein
MTKKHHLTFPRRGENQIPLDNSHSEFLEEFIPACCRQADFSRGDHYVANRES